MGVFTSGGSRLVVPGGALREPEFSELVSWTHSWDAKTAVLYTPDAAAQAEFGVSAVPHVSSIPDGGSGGVDYVRDAGSHAIETGMSDSLALPGPRFIESSERFNGRPCFRIEEVETDGMLTGYTMLTNDPDLHESANYFNPPTGYSTPWYVVMLGRKCGMDTAVGDDEDGPTCPSPGGTAGKWDVACFSNFPAVPSERIESTHDVSEDETVLLIVKNVGASSSFLEVNTRDSGGTAVTVHTPGSLLTHPWKTLFSGFVGDHGYISAIGIKLDAGNNAEFARIRRWAQQYMPSAGALDPE